MDVLAGRKTGGKIEGDIRVAVRHGCCCCCLIMSRMRCPGGQSKVHRPCEELRMLATSESMHHFSAQGHPKDQNTFARVSGYVEQNDIHS